MATLQTALRSPTNLVTLGVVLFLAGTLCYAVNDAIGKWLVTSYPVAQVMMLRSVGALIVLAPMILSQGGAGLFRVERPGLQVLRVVLATAETFLFFVAVAYLPLADVMTFYMAGPIYVAALSHVMLGERVGWRRWIAILVGFCGVVIALRPSTAAFSMPSFYALAGSLAFALLLMLSRVLRGTGDAILVTWQTVGMLVVAGVLTLSNWQTPSGVETSAMLLLGIIACFAQLLITRSLKLAPASILAPLQYSLLLWGALFGYLFFGDVPDAAILAGSAIIVVSGLFIFHRQKVVAEVPKEEVPTTMP
jgi:S-adenosylmethionine uptake transporter